MEQKIATENSRVPLEAQHMKTRNRILVAFLALVAILAFAAPVAAQDPPGYITITIPREDYQRFMKTQPTSASQSQNTERFCGVVDHTKWGDEDGVTVFTVFWKKGGGLFSREPKDPRPPYTFAGEPRFPPTDGGMYDFVIEKKRDSENRRVIIKITVATSCGDRFAK